MCSKCSVTMRSARSGKVPDFSSLGSEEQSIVEDYGHPCFGPSKSVHPIPPHFLHLYKGLIWTFLSIGTRTAV